MRLTQGLFRLGKMPGGDGGAVHWAANATDDTSTDYWTLHHDTNGDALTVTNAQSGVDTLTVYPDDTTRVRDLRITGTITHPVHLAGDHTRLSGFDANSRHWVHAGDGATTDQILAVHQHGTGNYSLHVSEGDTVERVLTTSGEGDLDAGSVGGSTVDELLHRDGRNGLTANLPASDYAITFTDGSVYSDTGDLVLDPTTDVRAASGVFRQNGNRVLDTSDPLGIDVENTDGSPLLTDVSAVHAGTDLDFSDDGDGTATLSFTGSTSPASAAVGTTATASGDGTTTTFTLTHTLDATPDAVSVDAASRAASTDYRITGVDASSVTIEYDTAPPSGTDNLSWHVTATASGLDAFTLSAGGSTVLTNPRGLDAGDGLTATDDGDGTATLGVDTGVARTDSAEHFPNAVSVGADTDLGFTNSSQTVQFAFAYDETNDRHEWVDRANSTAVAHVDRSGHVNFPQNLQVGGVDVATTSGDLANQGSGSAPADAVPTADGDGNIQWQRRTAGGGAVASGDGTTTTYAIPHNLDVTPGDATVTPKTKAAMGAFYISNLTSTDVVITYDAAPPSGTDNLDWSVTVHA